MAAPPSALLAAFAQGLLRPSWPGLLGALLVAGGWFGLACWRVTPAALAGLEAGHLPRSRRDHDAYVTHAALELAHSGAARGEVAVLGASTLLYALGDGAALAQELQRLQGEAVRVHNLCVPGAQLTDQALLAATVSACTGGALLVNVSPLQLAASPAQRTHAGSGPRLALAAAVWDAEVQAAGAPPRGRPACYFLQHFEFFQQRLPRLLLHLAHGPLPPPRFDPPPLAPGGAQSRGYLRERLAGFASWHADNLAVLERLVLRHRAHSRAPLLLLESTWNPAYLDELAPVLAPYRAALQEFCARHALVYLDLNEAAGLRPEEFRDSGHLASPAAARRYAACLAHALHRVLPARGVRE